MTYWRHGSYTHEAGEVNLLSFNMRPRTSPRNVRLSRILSAQIQGELHGTAAEILTKMNALIAAYNVDYVDSGLYYDDGTATPHVLTTSNSLSGVRVVYRSWDGKSGAELVNCRSYQIIVQAEYQDAVSQLVAFQERLQFIGDCGPRYAIQERRRGNARAVQINERTVQRIIQAGSAIGFQGYYLPPGPLWPQIEHRDRREIQYGEPHFNGQTFINYPSSWQYEFSSTAPLGGTPNAR